jgi:copper chaperone CopZ
LGALDKRGPGIDALRSASPIETMKKLLPAVLMCCAGCRPKVYAALSKIPGVREAAVDVGSATAIVKKDVDVAALEKALTFDEYVAHARK